MSRLVIGVIEGHVIEKKLCAGEVDASGRAQPAGAGTGDRADVVAG
ncbi:hypothetical protein [Streptomyces sp. NPDC046197]